MRVNSFGRRMRALSAVVLLGAVALGVSGCGMGGVEVALDGVRAQMVQVGDGREVACVVYKAGYSGGISCDWEGAK